MFSPQHFRVNGLEPTSANRFRFGAEHLENK